MSMVEREEEEEAHLSAIFLLYPLQSPALSILRAVIPKPE